jgi:hypothetical protein
MFYKLLNPRAALDKSQFSTLHSSHPVRPLTLLTLRNLKLFFNLELNVLESISVIIITIVNEI